jgi:hypothetical protein
MSFLEEYLLRFELLTTDEAGNIASQWVSVYLQGLPPTVDELQNVANLEGEALTERYGQSFAGVGELELEEV